MAYAQLSDSGEDTRDESLVVLVRSRLVAPKGSIAANLVVEFCNRAVRA